ncbi:MAG: hypothetical protein IT366_02065 [Candidatus Hydrogenedentes bacterium]|nr:hypothetical protein [Candidatus Hydrogenedentota bacterium]
MGAFPGVDPIPLPAPVWLFKLLNVVTLVLHFYAVHFLVGGLVVALLWRAMGKSKPAMLSGSDEIVRRLPLVMTYVINLGIPPLLFTQVLYGRALYTSSVLIGFWWISVIFMVIFSYALLYSMAKRADSSKAYGWFGLIALIVVLKVGMIYSSNMTLMLRPEAWSAMYATSTAGMHLPSGDPTTTPRWLYMMLASIGITGIGLMILPTSLDADHPARALLRSWGGKLLAVFSAVEIAMGMWVYYAQPEAVRSGLSGNSIYLLFFAIWLLTAVALIGAGWFASMGKGYALPSICATASFVNVLALVLLRDGIRDVSLSAHGLNVWDRTVVANWSTIILFLILFVVAVALVLWMGKVLITAQRETAQHG